MWVGVRFYNVTKCPTKMKSHTLEQGAGYLTNRYKNNRSKCKVMIEKRMRVSPLQYMPWLSRVCLHTAQWCFFLKFLSLKECEPIFSNYIYKHTQRPQNYTVADTFSQMYLYWDLCIWQEINPNTSANHKPDIKEHWAHMSTRPQSWWYEEHKSITHTLEVINEMYVCIREE